MSSSGTPTGNSLATSGLQNYNSPANSSFGSTQTPKGGSSTYVGGALPQTAAGVVGGTSSLASGAAQGQGLSNQYTPVIASAIGGPTGYNPADTTAQGQNVAQSANQFSPYISQALQSGFDPQNALFQQQQQLLQDQTRAAEAAQGVAGTPYGAGVEANTMQNFDLNWVNQELARQQQGAQTAGGLEQSYGQGATTGQSLAAAGPQTQNSLLSGVLSNILQGQAPTQQMIGDLQNYLTSQQSVQQGISQQNQQGLGLLSNFISSNQHQSNPKNMSGLGAGVGGIGQGLGTFAGSSNAARLGSTLTNAGKSAAPLAAAAAV